MQTYVSRIDTQGHETPASFRRRAGAAYAAHHAPKLQVPWELTLVELKSLDNCRKQNTTGIWYQ